MIPTPMVILRECRKCGWMGGLIGFSKNKGCRFGRSYNCLKCVAAKGRQWAADNPETRKATTQKYRNSDKGRQTHAEYNAQEKVQERRRERNRKYAASDKGKRQHAKWIAAHPDKPAEYNKTYLSKNPEARKATISKYYQNNKEKILAESAEWYKTKNGKDATRTKNARRRGIPQEKYPLGDYCEYCGRYENLTADHIIPVVFSTLHDIDTAIIGKKENMATACQQCNSSKNGKLPNTTHHIALVNKLLGGKAKDRFSEKEFWLPPADTLLRIK